MPCKIQRNELSWVSNNRVAYPTASAQIRRGQAILSFLPLRLCVFAVKSIFQSREMGSTSMTTRVGEILCSAM